MRHTKGPWKVGEQDGEIFIVDGFYVNLCAMVDGSYTPETIEANANLMATAPDLLKACKSILKNEESYIPYKSFKLMNEAINKAEGK